jgi:hypothetical protein
MAWIVPTGDGPLADPAYLDGGPWTFPVSVVGDRGSGQSWQQWAQQLAGRRYVAGQFTVEQMDVATPWDALVQARRTAIQDALAS